MSMRSGEYDEELQKDEEEAWPIPHAPQPTKPRKNGAGRRLLNPSKSQDDHRWPKHLDATSKHSLLTGRPRRNGDLPGPCGGSTRNDELSSSQQAAGQQEGQLDAEMRIVLPIGSHRKMSSETERGRDPASWREPLEHRLARKGKADWRAHPHQDTISRTRKLQDLLGMIPACALVEPPTRSGRY